MQRIWISLLVSAGMLLPTFVSGQSRNPGPYEILPIADAYIVEAFTDLDPTSGQIADWTGWSSTTWVSPNAYDNHGGTDFSVGSGTPCYAITTGTVITVVNDVPANTHPSNRYYGNYVKIKPDGLSPLGEELTVLTAHMLPDILVSVGQRVNAGQLIGYTDNTGNSTSEHMHIESALATGAIQCGFYHAHYKYPIMLNPTATRQVGHIVRIRQDSTPFYHNNSESSGVAGNLHKDQLYYAPFAKGGYYRIFVPNRPTRSAWVKATDVNEVLTGTVIQPLPDPGTYNHSAQLAKRYPIYDSTGSGGTVPNIIGYINWAGGRFVADQVYESPYVAGKLYRIALPGGTTGRWGWVKPDFNMVVYPELVNPTIDLSAAPNDQFPMVNDFNQLGPLDYGRPKFDRRSVVNFSPASPGGDGKALLLTDHGNTGNGVYETVSYGRPEYRNYYVQCDVYFRYRPSYGSYGLDYERYGVFLRDDGFGGFDETFEGAGNCYLMMYDSRTGLLTCGKSVNGVVQNFLTPAKYIQTDGWHEMRIEAFRDSISYFLDGQPQTSVIDGTFISGLSGIGYTGRIAGYPSSRGAYFDNFISDLLPYSEVSDWALY